MAATPKAITGVGLSTADFANRLRDLGPALDWFETLGLDSVELSLMAFEVIGGCRVYPDRLAELKRVCADRPFAFTVHGPVSSSFADPAHLTMQKDCCRACLEVSAELGAGVQVHHAGIIPYMTVAQRAETRAIERDALAEIAPHAADAGVVLAAETLFGRVEKWTHSPAELAALIAEIDHPAIRATIDFSHVFLNGAERGFNALAELHALAPLTRHLHIHDSFAVPRTMGTYNRGEAIGFGLGDLHLPPGRGTLPWEALAKLPFGGPTIANLEMTDRHREEVPDAVAWTRGWVARTA